MKKIFSFMLALLMVSGVVMSAPITVNAVSISDLSFELNYDGMSYSVKMYNKNACGELVIPATYDGKPVTSIADSAFYNCKSLTSIIIPNSVTSIGYCAFKDCTSLVSIIVGNSSIINVGEGLFYNCKKLEKLYWNAKKTNNEWGIESELFDNAGVSGPGIKIIFGDEVEEVAEYFCIGLGRPSKITSIEFGNNVKRIGTGAFEYNDSLTSIRLPVSVKTIEESAFDCSNLKYVFYKGTKKQWEMINFENELDRTRLTNTKIHYESIDHTLSPWIVSKKSNVNAPGSKYQKCTACGVKLKTAKIAQLKCAAPKLKAVTNVATGIKLTWNKVAGADNYEIYRKTGNSAWKKLATVKGTVTTYTDKTAKSGTTYKYTVKARNEAGLSKYNTTGLTIKCLADPVLKAPTSTKKGITLKWNKVTGAQGYVVYRKAGNGKLVKLATVKGVSKISYTDKKAKKGIKYSYKIRAYSGKTYSAQSNVKTIKDKY